MPTWPRVSSGERVPIWQATIASTLWRRRTPSSIIALAPRQPSSPGWKMKTTVPLRSCRCRDSSQAAPRAMAIWPSWPQACILPGYLEIKAWVFSSWMGRASISARMPIVGPGFAPRTMPTTPVLPTPLSVSTPQSWRRAAIKSAVSSTAKPTPGC